MITNILKENKLTIIITSIWLVVAILYFMRTPYDVRSHDFGAHLEYTEYIVRNNKLPEPYTLWQSYHPPLYYLVASLFVKDSVYTDVKAHTNKLRILSVFLGFLSVWIICSLLREMGINQAYVFLVTLFITTIPKYLFVFSTYNNDVLAMFSSMCVVYFAYKLSTTKWSNIEAFLLLLASTCALYSKYTAIFCIGAVLVFLCRKIFLLKIPNKNETKTILIILFSLCLLFPYLYIHNYKQVGKFFPTNFDLERIPLTLQSLNVKRIIRIPLLQFDPHEWNDPWSHPEWDYAHPAKKSHDYWGFMFVTSLIGEYQFGSPRVNFYWLLYFIHFLIGFLSVCSVFKSPCMTRFFASCGLLGYVVNALLLLQIPYSHPCSMDFRYMAWLWLCWAVLQANIFFTKIPLLMKIATRLLVVGIFVQIFLLMTMR